MNILKPLIYFSLFDHPLTEEEIFQFSKTATKNSLREEVDTLIQSGVIKKVDEFLLYKKDLTHITKRVNGKKNANAVMPRAKKIASFISKFPFVEGIGISGSLSKGYYDAESDFDFFVITKAKRVWLTRTLIAFYKRLFLRNSYKEFCVNYFVSTETLEIEEKNRFTATEIITVIPLYGKQTFEEFYQKNRWVIDYFPNYKLLDNLEKTYPIIKTRYSQVFEFLLNNFVGRSINYLCMKHITKRWKNRYKTKINSPYKSKKEISKHHPENFQDKVIKKLNLQYKCCLEKYGIHIPEEHA